MTTKYLFFVVMIAFVAANLTDNEKDPLETAEINFKKHIKNVYQELNHFGEKSTSLGLVKYNL